MNKKGLLLIPLAVLLMGSTYEPSADMAVDSIGLRNSAKTFTATFAQPTLTANRTITLPDSNITLGAVTFEDGFLLVADSLGNLKKTDIRHTIADVTRFPKIDVGNYDVDGGADFGTGGSFYKNEAGTVVVKVYQYDASETTDTRFTEITDLDANYTWLGATGDRMYFGLPKKFWAARFQIGVAKTNEILISKFYNGSALEVNTYSTINKTTSALIADRAFLEGSVGDKEYIQFDMGIDATWATSDDIVDVIPDTGVALYWIALENPGALSTAPRTDEIRLRRSDTDIVTGKGSLIYWGSARPVTPFNVHLNSIIKTSTFPKVIDKDITSSLKLPLYEFRDNQTDQVEINIIIADEYDTGCKVPICLTYYATAVGDFDWVITWKILKQGTTVGVGESNTGTFTFTHTPSAINTWQVCIDLSGTTNKLDLSSMNADDTLIVGIQRNGSADTSSGLAYPATVGFDFTTRASGGF